MTLKELYTLIDADYDSAMRVLRMEKLLDKHIRKLPANPVFADLDRAGQTLDPTAVFDSAHAIKGVCANLGLVKLAQAASVLCEAYRPGSEQPLSADETRQKIDEIQTLYGKAADGVRRYVQENG